MKISIPATLINTAVARFGASAALITANFDIPSSKKTEEKDIPFFKNIKEYSNKKVTVTKTEDALEISVNDDFLEDIINVVSTSGDKLIPKLVPVVKTIREYQGAMQALYIKWNDVKETVFEDVKVESKTVSVEEVKAKTPNPKKDVSLLYPTMKKVVVDLSITEKYFIKPLDKTLSLNELSITRKTEDEVYVVSPFEISLILGYENNKDYPQDIIDAIRAYYKVSFNK